jgi:hypothetical protein
LLVFFKKITWDFFYEYKIEIQIVKIGYEN